jgi:hypothetical protein
MFGKLQLYALIGGAFMLGLIGIYSAGISRGQDRVRRKIDASRISNLQSNKEISDEINSMDDPYLVQSARKWVRKD